MTTFTFGKYRGKTPASIAKNDIAYLEWASTTDIPTKYPDLGEAIKSALNEADKSPATLAPYTLPSLHVLVRGGGSMHEGVIIQRVNEKLFAEYAIIDEDNRSGSGKSGGYTVETPADDGVYLVTETSGSISNQVVETQYVVLKNGEWFSIDENNKNAVKQYMEDNAPAKKQDKYLRCKSCGQTGTTGGYPFSTLPGSGLCDDCV